MPEKPCPSRQRVDLGAGPRADLDVIGEVDDGPAADVARIAGRHRGLLTQIRLEDSPVRTFYDTRKAQGMSDREELRRLRRPPFGMVVPILKNTTTTAVRHRPRRRST